MVKNDSGSEGDWRHMTKLLCFSISDVLKERKFLNKHLIDNKYSQISIATEYQCIKTDKIVPLEIVLTNSSKAFKVTMQLSYVLTHFTG